MLRFLRTGLASAFAAVCMLSLSGAASAQVQVEAQPASVQPQTISLRSVAVQSFTKLQRNAFAIAMATPSPVVATTTSVQPVYGPTLGQAAATPMVGTSVALLIAPAPTLAVITSDLAALVSANSVGDALDSEAACLATAVYFEARGEGLDGQLAVAQVVMNRAVSGRYPTSWCAVVKQRAQFSFVRAGGRFPAIKPDCPQWVRAQAIARIATKRLASSLSPDVLWYHATYVAPSWGRRLSRVSQIGAHIFYRT